MVCLLISDSRICLRIICVGSGSCSVRGNFKFCFLEFYEIFFPNIFHLRWFARIQRADYSFLYSVARDSLEISNHSHVSNLPCSPFSPPNLRKKLRCWPYLTGLHLHTPITLPLSSEPLNAVAGPLPGCPSPEAEAGASQLPSLLTPVSPAGLSPQGLPPSSDVSSVLSPNTMPRHFVYCVYYCAPAPRADSPRQVW